MKAALIVSLVLLVLLSGCIRETDLITDGGNGNGSGQLNVVIPGGSDTTDPCGNGIGNGNVIISGPDIGAHSGDRDNPFRSLTVHPADPDTVLIGTENNGFMMTRDGGSTWTRIRAGLRHEEWGYPEIYDIAWSESNESVIYAATTNGPGPVTGSYPSSSAGIYKSVDGGETWSRKNCGIPCGAVLSVYVDPRDENHAFVGIQPGTPNYIGFDVSDTHFDGGMYETSDGGDSWHEVEIGTLGPRNSYMQIMSARDSPSVMFASGIADRHMASNSDNLGLVRSGDNGKTWTRIGSGLGETTINYFTVSADGNSIYGISESQIHVSNDGGKTWSTRDTSVSALYFISASPADENRVFYGMMADVRLSKDGLQTDSVAIPVERIGDKHVSEIVFAPSDPDIVYAIFTGAYPSNPGYDLYRSDDAGETFSKIGNLREDVLRKMA